MKQELEQAKPVIILLAVSALMVVGIAWVMNGGLKEVTEEKEGSVEILEAPLTADRLEDYDVDINNDMNPVAVINTNKGIIEIELFQDTMPITSGNFIKLAEEGFYDGVKFHRVIDGFMIQGGDPITKTDEVMRYGTGGPDYSIPDEHVRAELLTNVRGTLSMANSGPNSGGSQFFINLNDNTNLDFDKPPLTSKHPVFGRVVGGMDIVDEIAKVEVNPNNNLPLDSVVMETVTIRSEG
jgi:peptidylprolyl isomerase